MSTDLTPVPNVLVVEDEMILRMRAVDIVEDAGFCPVEAVNADEAMSILESRSDISLLFTDIQMPGSIDGLKLAHAVHERWPSIKIILVSGQVKPSDAETPEDSRFFGKPPSVEQMITELQAMVGAGALQKQPGRQTLSFQRAECQDYLGSRHCVCDDVQRAVHQHDQVWSLVRSHGPRGNRMDDRRIEAKASPCLDGKRRSAGRASNAPKLRHPNDGVSRPTIDR
jgi:CheY-like chemotaxis protein